MSNWVRLGISAIVSAIMAAIAYMFPLTLLLYFFAPGFWLGNLLPDSIVNALGGYLFPVFPSAIIWMFLIFGLWWLIARGRRRRRRT